eukprot:TRINITY_DN49593_c0_g1_i1.p1 TRINITY_DN49593_c0_g1~~TRINITY_DN49593_c0_g1_i1.p1  ORF type:complete len:909 (-),score=184.57 TRINITY_DN49593_c0_g1_i1:136-2862(-)
MSMAAPPADAGTNSIRVSVRCRPFSAKELSEAESEEALECDGGTVSTLVGKPKAFSYDQAFGIQSSQTEVFEAIGSRLLNDALNAYNGCIFAYGQTGSGKSFSVVGNVENEDQAGLLPRACKKLFDMIKARCSAVEEGATTQSFQATVLASYFEIYNEKVFDLLTSKRQNTELVVRYHPQLGPIVVGLTECPMASSTEALDLFDFGLKKRAVAATQMNATSSRSHAIFTILIRMKEKDSSSSRESHTKTHFVDLAGSERQKKTEAVGDRLKEGIGINQSLTTLGRVIAELTKPGSSSSVPAFRDSKLTLILKDALMGNSRTELLACVSPSKSNIEETISTLEFASRCKLIKTSAKKNEDCKMDVIKQLQAERDEIQQHLHNERTKTDQMTVQLKEELERAQEHKRVADEFLAQKAAIEEKLKSLNADSARDPLMRENTDLLREEAEMSEMIRRKTAAADELREMLDKVIDEEKQQRDAIERVKESRKALEIEHLTQLKREEELRLEIEALATVHDSLALNHAELDRRRKEHTFERRSSAFLSKFATNFEGVHLSDMNVAPKFVNLNPDPSLDGCLVYYLPKGETKIGSDSELCSLTLSRPDIGPEVCVLVNIWNTHVLVRSLSGDDSILVNGCQVSEVGTQLFDGDRLAIGRGFIFQVHIPGALSDANLESDVDDGSTKQPDQSGSGIETAILLVKAEFGMESANRLMDQARKAGEAVAVANAVLHDLPRKWRRRIKQYEFGILFTSQIVQNVHIFAHGDGPGDSSPSAGGPQDGPRAGLWEVDEFCDDVLPVLTQALDSWNTGRAERRNSRAQRASVTQRASITLQASPTDEAEPRKSSAKLAGDAQLANSAKRPSVAKRRSTVKAARRRGSTCEIGNLTQFSESSDCSSSEEESDDSGVSDSIQNM